MRGVIPDELIDRPKQGFRVPVEEWLLRDLGDRTRREVADMCANDRLARRVRGGARCSSGPDATRGTS